MENIYHYERVIGDKVTKLTEEELEKEIQNQKGQTVIVDDIIEGLDDLSVEELKILAGKN